MITLTQVAMFSAASIILIFTPGPDIIYVMTRGIAQGRKAAISAAAGFSLGNIFHILCAVVGLSALITSSAAAFQIVKIAGAVYLIWLGVKIFRSDAEISMSKEQKSVQLKSIFKQSIIANMLNPKVAVFFLAFFPQFIETDRGHVAVQMLILGCIFVVLTFIGFSMVGYGSGKIGNWLSSNPTVGNRINKIAGSVLVFLGLRLAFR
ncbi:LysE family translocator [Desulfococcaceae bacterium HSG8]|nr:LysE family translocator [Desulfococcaceae bacterium HSG8]